MATVKIVSMLVLRLTVVAMGTVGAVSGPAIPQAIADDSVCIRRWANTTVSTRRRIGSTARSTPRLHGTRFAVLQDGRPAAVGTDGRHRRIPVLLRPKLPRERCAGNPNARLGKAIMHGKFICLSEERGVTCTACGHGFTISTSGIATAG